MSVDDFEFALVLCRLIVGACMVVGLCAIATAGIEAWRDHATEKLRREFEEKLRASQVDLPPEALEALLQDSWELYE